MRSAKDISTDLRLRSLRYLKDKVNRTPLRNINDLAEKQDIGSMRQTPLREGSALFRRAFLDMGTFSS